jgi:hypothetical protein
VAQDDWRVSVILPAEEHSGRLVTSLAEIEVEEDVRKALGDRVIVGGGENAGVVYLYAGTRDAARGAEAVVRRILADHDVQGDIAIDRWHPEEERWEPEAEMLPETEAEYEAEHEQLEEDEIEESQGLGAALWEVRIELDSHHDASGLADRLEAESDSILPGMTITVVRHWKYLLIGVDNEDQAHEIVEKIRPQLPVGAELKVEASGALVWQSVKVSPFAVLGGLST